MANKKRLFATITTCGDVEREKFDAALKIAREQTGIDLTATQFVKAAVKREVEMLISAQKSNQAAPTAQAQN